jgi:zinc transporter, ZIP family
MGGTKMKKKKSSLEPLGFDWWGSLTLTLIIAITLFGSPQFSSLFLQQQQQQEGETSLHEVWYYGWITAVSTGLGIIPFFFVNKPNRHWMGVSNGSCSSAHSFISPIMIFVAVAGGMMVAASYGLLSEGFDANDVPGFYGYHAGFRTMSGGILGFLFVIVMKEILDQFEDLKVGNIDGEGAHRLLLVMFVMTLHSVSEGIGIGVSFGTLLLLLFFLSPFPTSPLD